MFYVRVVIFMSRVFSCSGLIFLYPAEACDLILFIRMFDIPISLSPFSSLCYCGPDMVVMVRLRLAGGSI